MSKCGLVSKSEYKRDSNDKIFVIYGETSERLYLRCTVSSIVGPQTDKSHVRSCRHNWAEADASETKKSEWNKCVNTSSGKP